MPKRIAAIGMWMLLAAPAQAHPPVTNMVTGGSFMEPLAWMGLLALAFLRPRQPARRRVQAPRR